MASTYLTRTNGTATNNKICTFSAWLKLASDSSYMRIFTAQSDVTGRDSLYINSGELNFYQRNGTTSSVGISGDRLFRDVSAWYHLVVACDSTQATASDRIKIYLNGEQQTLDGTQIPQNQTFAWNEDNLIAIGADSDGSPSEYFNGSMSHVHFIDGTAYDASAFGSTDATTGEWKINTSPSVTYGTNGFFILKDSNSVTDQSGNSNNFTVGGGTLTKTEDNPSNVFATMNSLDQNGGMTFSEGNLSVASTSASWRSTRGTLGVTQGKWYYELKVTNVGGSLLDMMVGWGDFEIAIPSEFSSSNPALLYTAGGDKRLNGVASSYGAAYNINDIIGVAFDADNLTVEFFKNGTSQGSISTGWSSGITWTPIISLYGRYNNTKASFNFGNGYFGSTQISSAGTNASGIGIFEYDVPTGYTALSTKGLNL